MLGRITIQEHERGLLFRRGRLVQQLDPGPHWVLGRVEVVSLARRQTRVEIAPALTRVGTPVGVVAVITFRVTDARMAVVDTEDHLEQLQTDARAALARAVGARTPIELASTREELEREAESRLAFAAASYGVHVEDVWLEELRLPRALRRAWKRDAATLAPRATTHR